MVCRLAYIPEDTLVHVVGLALTKDNQVRLIYSQALLLLSHTCRRVRNEGVFADLKSFSSFKHPARRQLDRMKVISS